jgi:hypothetical protein
MARPSAQRPAAAVSTTRATAETHEAGERHATVIQVPQAGATAAPEEMRWPARACSSVAADLAAEPAEESPS